MKIKELLKEEQFSYEFQSKEEGYADLMKTALLSPIQVDAHYADYPSIDEETDEWYQEFFDSIGAARINIGHYKVTLTDTKELKRLIDSAENHFNDPDYGEPGESWSFMFTVYAGE